MVLLYDGEIPARVHPQGPLFKQAISRWVLLAERARALAADAKDRVAELQQALASAQSAEARTQREVERVEAVLESFARYRRGESGRDHSCAGLEF